MQQGLENQNTNHLLLPSLDYSEVLQPFWGPILSGVLLEAGKAAMSSDSARYGKFGFGGVEIFVGSCALATSIGSLAIAAIGTRAQ